MAAWKTKPEACVCVKALRGRSSVHGQKTTGGLLPCLILARQHVAHVLLRSLSIELADLHWQLGGCDALRMPAAGVAGGGERRGEAGVRERGPRQRAAERAARRRRALRGF